MPPVGGVGAPPPPAGPGPSGPLGPALGAVVEVEILDVIEPGVGRVALGRWTGDARFPEHLTAGARFPARVASLGPPTVLQPLPAPEANPARLLPPPAQPLAQAVEAILSAGDSDPAAQPLARLLSLPQDPEALAPALARWVRASGVFHEADLARGEAYGDVKTLAQRLLQRLPEGPLRDAAEALVRHVEAHQARSLAAGEPVVPLVLPWPQGPVQGEIRLEPDETSGRPGRPTRYRAVRIRLDLPHLGRVEARVAWVPEGVRISLGASPEVLPLLRRELGALRSALAEGAGVRLLGLGVEALRPSAEPEASLWEVRA
ncbi:flagellar hook-length control protein FliK [Deferrisoma palaeochoriense]